MTRRKMGVGILVLVGTVGLYGLLSRLADVMPIAAPPSVGCFDGCPPSTSLHRRPSGNGLLHSDVAISEVLDTANPNKKEISVLIEKNKYRLTVYHQRQPIKSYPIVLGSAPTGDKLREGDRKTPEGLFRIRDLYPHVSWSKFLWLDYPTPESWQKHLEAKRAGRLDSTATIGGEVGIHGVPEGKDAWIEARQNWTWGCVSLKNKDIDELYSIVQIGTVVEIVP
jgi:murein L,D-transpeptidase YafK